MVSPFGGMGSGAEDSLNFGHTELHSGSTRHAQWCFLNWRSVDYISLRQLQHAFSYYKLGKVPQKCKVFGFSPASLVPEFISLVYMLGKASRAFNYLQLTWKEFEFRKRTACFTSDWSWSRSWQPCPHLKSPFYSLRWRGRCLMCGDSFCGWEFGVVLGGVSLETAGPVFKDLVFQIQTFTTIQMRKRPVSTWEHEWNPNNSFPETLGSKEGRESTSGSLLIFLFSLLQRKLSHVFLNTPIILFSFYVKYEAKPISLFGKPKATRR